MRHICHSQNGSDLTRCRRYECSRKVRPLVFFMARCLQGLASEFFEPSLGRAVEGARVANERLEVGLVTSSPRYIDRATRVSVDTRLERRAGSSETRPWRRSAYGSCMIAGTECPGYHTECPTSTLDDSRVAS